MHNTGHATETPGHVIPKGTLFGAYFGLLFLSALMIGLSRVDLAHLGPDWADLHALKAWSIMGIALVSGIIVAMVLMGLAFEEKLLNLTVFISNFVFLLIFVLFTWADTSFRGEMDAEHATMINFTSPVKPSADGGHGDGHGTPHPAPAAGHEAVEDARYMSPGANTPAPAEAHPAAPAAVPADTAKAHGAKAPAPAKPADAKAPAPKAEAKAKAKAAPAPKAPGTKDPAH